MTKPKYRIYWTRSITEICRRVEGKSTEGKIYINEVCAIIKIN